MFLSVVFVGCNENVNNNDGKGLDADVDINDIFNKGKVYLEQDGDVEKAIEQFNKALKIDDKADWIIADLGRAKQEKGDIEGAIECYTRAIELNNQRSAYYYWRSVAYGSLGKEDLAQKDKEIADDLHSKGLN